MAYFWSTADRSSHREAMLEEVLLGCLCAGACPPTTCAGIGFLMESLKNLVS